MKKRRAIIIRIYLDEYDKKILSRYFRRSGYGLHKGLSYCCSNAVIMAKDDESERERNKSRK